MSNRRDETGKLTCLFFLELTINDGLKFITRGRAHHILSFKGRITMSLWRSISAYGMKLMV